jgi:putative flippase GtrA
MTKKKKTIKALIIQFIKFALIGGISFIVDIGLMILIKELLGASVIIATTISYCVSVFVNYFLSIRYVFKSNGKYSKTKELSIYLLLSLIGLAINDLIMWYAGVLVGDQYYIISKIVSTIIVTFYNFSSRKIFLEKKSKTSDNDVN